MNDTATLSGGFNPTGTVTFKLFAPGDDTCSTNPVYTDADATDPYDTSTSGGGYVSLVAGTYRWTADYAGDANNDPVSSGCQEEPVEIVQPLIVEKTAVTSYDREWDWAIDKTADQTALELAEGESFDVDYTIVVDATSQDVNHSVSGDITITNPAGNPAATIASIDDIDDELDASGVMTVDCGAAVFPVVLNAEESLECTYSGDAATTDTLNTVTVTATGVPGGSDTADVVWGDPANEIDECITVSDTYGEGPQGVQVCADDVDKTFNYTVTFGPDTNPEADVIVACGENTHPNTASFVTNDTGAQGNNDHNVNVTVECVLGCTLTQGYWKTHNDSFKGGAPTDDEWFTLFPVLGEDTIFYLSEMSWFDVFWTAPKGNAYYNLAHQYVAARLNVSNGASVPTEVQDALNDATAFFEANTPDDFNALPKKSQERKDVLTWAGILGSYNEGAIGPGHCDEQNPV